LFQAFGALLRLAAPLALRSFRHLPSPFVDSEAVNAEIGQLFVSRALSFPFA
jgi:hypothetical protein